MNDDDEAYITDLELDLLKDEVHQLRSKISELERERDNALEQLRLLD